jgi:hypothetical protein
MRKAAFISHHEPTPEQLDMAEKKGFELVHVGDCGAFNVRLEAFEDYGAVCVVHPAAALRLCLDYDVLIFENAERDGQFKPVKLHCYSLIVGSLQHD